MGRARAQICCPDPARVERRAGPGRVKLSQSSAQPTARKAIFGLGSGWARVGPRALSSGEPAEIIFQIPQFASGSLPSLPTSRDGHNPVETPGELSSSSHRGAIRPYESSDLSSLRSVISNGSSAEAHRSMNRIFTPASTPLSNRSTGFPLAQPSHKPTTPSYSALDRSSRCLSVDDFHLNINSNALLDLSRRDEKKISRPRSMSDRGPNRYDISTELFGRSNDSIHNSPRTAMYSLPLVTHQFPQSTRWNTTSIAQMIRESTTSELNKLVTEALKTYHPDSHRFVTGDIEELIRQGRQAEQKAEDLHRKYLYLSFHIEDHTLLRISKMYDLAFSRKIPCRFARERKASSQAGCDLPRLEWRERGPR